MPCVHRDPWFDRFNIRALPALACARFLVNLIIIAIWLTQRDLVENSTTTRVSVINKKRYNSAFIRGCFNGIQTIITLINKIACVPCNLYFALILELDFSSWCIGPRISEVNVGGASNSGSTELSIAEVRFLKTTKRLRSKEMKMLKKYNFSA